MDWLQWRPDLGFFYRTNNIPRFDKERGIFFKLPKYTPKGVPDITGVLSGSGRACFIECKAPKGRLSPDQISFQIKVISMGAIYILAKSIDDLEAAFSEPLQPKRDNFRIP